uniref:hypothetical protein n=1 Tax=Cupriavidus taiwanensis TaxID=164546 RepID=UPI003D18B037
MDLWVHRAHDGCKDLFAHHREIKGTGFTETAPGDIDESLVARGQASALVMRGVSLSAARYVVKLAFDGQQRGRTDVLGTHGLTPHVSGAEGNMKLLKHGPNSVEIEVGGHIEQ